MAGWWGVMLSGEKEQDWLAYPTLSHWSVGLELRERKPPLKPVLCCVFEHVQPTCFTQWEQSCSLFRIIPLGIGWVTLQKTRQIETQGGEGADGVCNGCLFKMGWHWQRKRLWTVWSILRSACDQHCPPLQLIPQGNDDPSFYPLTSRQI